MPAYNFIDLTGQIFGRLTVIKKVNRKKRTKQKTARWWCQCSCGNIINVDGHHLRRNYTKSCGCLHSEFLFEKNYVHGKAYTPEYRTWHHMKERCYDPNDKNFKNYGGRGITVCDEWRDDFMAFYNYIGPKPSPLHSIERINNNGNYKPGNVEWALPKKQANNKRSSHFLTINGETHTIMQWAKLVGIKPTTLYNRIYKGLSPEQAICQPVRHIT